MGSSKHNYSHVNILQSLKAKGWIEALTAYIRADKPFFGICLGMQSLFEGSEESPHDEGLGIIPGRVTRFDNNGTAVRVPQIGWNGICPVKHSPVIDHIKIHEKVVSKNLMLARRMILTFFFSLISI